MTKMTSKIDQEQDRKKNVCYVSDARARTFNFPENLIGRVGRKT